MSRRKLLILGLGIASPVILGGLYGCNQPSTQENRPAIQSTAPNSNGAEELRIKASTIDADLDPARITFGKLDEIMLRCSESRTTSRSISNAPDVEWCKGAVVARFFAYGEIPPSTRPISLYIEMPYKGSLRGIHLGDPVEKILTLGRKYGKKPKSDQKYRSEVDLDGPWSISWTEDGGKIRTLRVRDRTYKYY
jgi:hypothetical protein